MIEDLKDAICVVSFCGSNRLGTEQSLSVDLLNYPFTCISMVLTIAIYQRLEGEA